MELKKNMFVNIYDLKYNHCSFNVRDSHELQRHLWSGVLTGKTESVFMVVCLSESPCVWLLKCSLTTNNNYLTIITSTSQVFYEDLIQHLRTSAQWLTHSK